MDRFDVIVIGSGAAGQTVAHAARSAGRSVALVDKDPFGGTCALRGCDPKKVLVSAAAAVLRHRHLAGAGALTGDARIDWRGLMAFKRSFTEPVPSAREASFREAGIEPIRGTARFASKRAVEVEGRVLEFDRLAICAGARPQPLGISGEELVTTSTGFLDLDDLPRRVAFIGGGYISFEFAHVAAAAGAEVTILHRGDRPLGGFDPVLVDQLVEATRAAGIDVRLAAPVRSVKRQGDALVVGAEGAEITVDLVVHGAGRVPDLEALDLAKGDVARGKRGGVAVNSYLQSTTNPRVYAAGDAAETGPPLTPVASLEGEVAAANLLDEGERPIEHGLVPSVVFTSPPLARVGMTEEEAREKGFRYRAQAGDTTAWQSSRRLAAPASGYRILVEEGSERILGAHLLGPRADDVINVLATAMRAGLAATEVRKALYAYPTHGSDLRYMA